MLKMLRPNTLWHSTPFEASSYADESAVGGAESQRLCRLIEFSDSDDPDNNPGNGSGNDNDHTNKSDLESESAMP